MSSVDCSNYFFAFRWVLCLFKRELASFDDVLRLWEAIWSEVPTEHFLLYCCLAVLRWQRESIMNLKLEFDDILKYVNAIARTVDLSTMMQDAERLHSYAREAGLEPQVPPRISALSG